MKKSVSLFLALLLLLGMALHGMADAPAVLTASAGVGDIRANGDILLSLTGAELLGAGYNFGDLVTVRFLDRSLELPFCGDDAELSPGSPALLARERDPQVLLSVKSGDFATSYGIAVRTTYAETVYFWTYQQNVTGPVSFTIAPNAPEEESPEPSEGPAPTEDPAPREDFPSQAEREYANFRAVNTQGMGRGTLYRTASPVDPQNLRNTIADAAIAAVGVTVVMNLADDLETLLAYPGFADTYYATTNYIALNMGLDFFIEDFQAKLLLGLRHFAANPGVYAVHCTWGKDRVGFVIAVLECLMGASYEEIIADYMISHSTYSGVTVDDPSYLSIANENIVNSLRLAFGVSELQSADLAAEAEEYVRAIGLSEADLAALKANLSADHVPGETPPEQGENPPEQGETPPEQGETPPEQGETPPEQGETPPEQGETPPEQGETPPEQGETPPEQGETPPEPEGPAPHVELSPQSLSVDGIARTVEMYNIDGYNYFKLRDLAMLLTDSPARFSVDWDAETNAVLVFTGAAYSPVGGELEQGEDRSATAVRSPQTIWIDGQARSDLLVYNLGGNNFFQLRNLGEALGFEVDYDAETNTALIRTGPEPVPVSGSNLVAFG
ncbi:MAG: tyrosine-protein phosphatase [Oscillospiraceae bacterium]|nr:tyrosine-protein phosphatase [Oscillospiraceae bacterium]